MRGLASSREHPKLDGERVFCIYRIYLSSVACSCISYVDYPHRILHPANSLDIHHLKCASHVSTELRQWEKHRTGRERDIESVGLAPPGEQDGKGTQGRDYETGRVRGRLVALTGVIAVVQRSTFNVQVLCVDLNYTDGEYE